MTPLQWKRLFIRTVMWVGFFISFAVLTLLASTTWRVYVRERAASEEHKYEAQALIDLEKRKATLDENIAKLETERGIEEEVRKRFPVVKPGESEILIVVPKEEVKKETLKTHWWDTALSFIRWW